MTTKKPGHPMSTKRMEAKLLWEHVQEGRKRYGRKRFEQANIGWAQDEWAICSKVYGDPAYIFSSEIDVYGVVTHQEELYK